MCDQNYKPAVREPQILKVGDLKNAVSCHSKSVLQIARHMRIRPEAVLQLLSDAFDERLVKRAIVVENGCIHFEADIATVTLIPGDNGLPPWELKYTAKIPMLNKAILPHPKEAFTIPQTLFDGDVLFPHKQLRLLMMLVTGNDELPTDDWLDVLNHDYCKALNDGTMICEENVLVFKTQFETQDGTTIYAAIEPDFDEPIPNTWILTQFRCDDNLE